MVKQRDQKSPPMPGTSGGRTVLLFCLKLPQQLNKFISMNLAAIRKGHLSTLLVLTPAMLSPLSAHALGFRFPNQDAEAIGRGDAFAATADNPSAIYYNPAGITQLEGQNLQFGVHALSANS